MIRGLEPARAAAAVLAVAAAAATGCVMPDQLAQVQKDVADVQQHMRQLRDEQRDAIARLEAFEASRRDEASRDDGRVSREEIADLQLSIDRVSRQMGITEERVNDLHARLDRLSHEMQQIARRGPGTGGGIVPPAPPPVAGGALEPERETVPPDPSASPYGTGAAAVPEPEALYNTAYADFSKGNYSLAVEGFEEYQERFSDSALADNAVYWIGESHFSQGDYDEAVGAFDRLLELYPTSDKAPAANLKKAIAFEAQNRISQAIVQYRFVATSYPDSDEARIASDKLASLGATPR
jgi:tol-pal system protein YbgF